MSILTRCVLLSCLLLSTKHWGNVRTKRSSIMMTDLCTCSRSFSCISGLPPVCDSLESLPQDRKCITLSGSRTSETSLCECEGSKTYHNCNIVGSRLHELIKQVYVNVNEQGYTITAVQYNQRLHKRIRQVYVNGLPLVRATQAGRSLRHLGEKGPRHRRPGGRCGPLLVVFLRWRSGSADHTLVGFHPGSRAQGIAGTRAQRTIK